jgi:hypothetical protein
MANRRETFISDYRTASTLLVQALQAIDGLTGEYQGGGYATGGTSPIIASDFDSMNGDIDLTKFNAAIASFAALKTFISPAHYGNFVRVRKP